MHNIYQFCYYYQQFSYLLCDRTLSVFTYQDEPFLPKYFLQTAVPSERQPTLRAGNYAGAGLKGFQVYKQGAPHYNSN